MGLLIRFRYVVVLVASALSLLALFMLAVETGNEPSFTWDKFGWDDMDGTLVRWQLKVDSYFLSNQL